MAIGERDARRTVRARWDALDDYTILVREVGAGSCGPCRDDCEGDAQHRDNEQQSDRREGETMARDRHETGSSAASDCNHGKCARSDDRDHDAPADRKDDHRRKRCGPTVVSETDIRGMVVLHVLSEDGRLHVME